jgi:hypothetical protein
MRSQAQGSSLVLLLALTGIGMSFIGWTLPVAKTASCTQLGYCKNGTITITLTAGLFVGSNTVVFSPRFPTGSQVKLIPYYSPNNLASIGTTLLPAGGLSFISPGSAQTWNNMPIVKTPIFCQPGCPSSGVGSSVANQFFDFSGITQVGFGVSCINNSVNASAIIRPEYSLDFVNWFDLAQTPGSYDSNISFCGGPTLSTSTIATAARAPVDLRIVGLNGGKTGDNPSFGNIYLEIYAPNPFPFSPSSGNCTPTQCTVQLSTTISTHPTITFTLSWYAYVVSP